jgi:hypothetical protein
MANLKTKEKNSPRNYYNIKKKLTIASTVLLAFVIIAATIPSITLAASPHFIGTPTISKFISGNTATLTTSGKVAGLGSAPTQVFLTTSGVIATTVCTNGGGNNPPGQTAVFGPTQGQIATIQPRNGQITFINAAPLSIAISAAQAGCPDSMRPVITSATFANVVLHIVQNEQEVLTYNFGNVDP